MMSITPAGAKIRPWTCIPAKRSCSRGTRFLVWNDEKRPMAAFPPVQDASTPEALAARFELAGYVPLDTDLKSPPPA